MLRLAANSASLISSAVTIRASSFVMYVMVARYRGAFEFGQLALATTVFAVLLEIALVGCRRVIVRDVAAAAWRSRPLLLHGTLLALGGSIVALALAWAFVSVMPYEAATSSLIVLVALGMWPAAVAQVTESVAQGWERAQLVLAVQGPVSLLKVVAAYVALDGGHGVVAIAWILIAGHVLAAGASAVLIASRAPERRLRPSLFGAGTLARAGLPFLGINLTAALRSNLATLLVSGFLGETSVGLFNAANQLTVPIRLVYQNLVMSFFPAMVRRFRAGAASLTSLAGDLIGFLSALTLPLIVTAFVLAEPLLVLLYGQPSFSGAAVVLMITIWAPFLDTLKSVLGHALWAGHHEHIVMRVTFSNLLVSVVSGLVLVPALGLVGAAVNVLLVSGVNAIQHVYATRQALRGVVLLRRLWRPGLAAAAMTAVSILSLPLGSAVAVAIGGIVYVAVLAALVILGAGGLRALHSRYITPWLG